jgi:hypothetical protein
MLSSVKEQNYPFSAENWGNYRPKPHPYPWFWWPQTCSNSGWLPVIKSNEVVAIQMVALTPLTRLKNVSTLCCSYACAINWIWCHNNMATSASARISKGQGYQGFLRKRAGSSFGKKRAICVVQGNTWKKDRILLLLGSIKCFPTSFSTFKTL